MFRLTAPSGSTMVRAVEVSSAVVSLADSPVMYASAARSALSW